MTGILSILIMAVLVWLVLFMWTATLNYTTQISGAVQASTSVSVSDSVLQQSGPTSIPAAQPGTLTHTTNTTGTILMTNAGHGITTGQRVDIYWSGGQCYNATVGTVSGLSVPISAVSGGSNLPSTGTTVYVGIATQVTLNVVGNNLTALLMQGVPASYLGYFVFDASSSDDYAALITGGYFGGWKTGDTTTNPLATYTITSVWMSHSNPAAACTTMLATVLAH
jgi:hypothetical protein